MTYFYSTKTWTSQPQTKVTEDQITFWKHIADKKNWRIVQLPNGFYQTEYKDQDDTWVDVTRRETIEGETVDRLLSSRMKEIQMRYDSESNAQ